MNWASTLRGMAAGVAVLAPFAIHAALAARWDAVALGIAGVQAAASGPLLWPVLPGRMRGLAVLVPSVLLAGLVAGAARSRADGVLAVIGLGHAMLYATLLLLFAASLRPGRVSIVTALARRLNPRFRPGMVPYTRAVTAIWCGFFGLQLLGSALLLAVAPVGWWLLWVGSLHLPLAIALGLAEFAARAWRFPGEHTGLRETIRGVRPGAWRGAGGGTSVRGGDCP